MALLTGCPSNSAVTYVYPPTEPLEPCTADYGYGTGESITTELVRLVDCERGGKAEVKAWIDGHRAAEPENRR